MEVKKLFTETFNIRLAQSLPMKDAYFTADLASRGLFPGDLKEEVREQSTRAQQAKFFIEKTAETGNTESFLQLLAAMEEYSVALKDLAQEIKSKFPSSSSKQSRKRERTPSESDSVDESPQKKSHHYKDAKPKSTTPSKPPPKQSRKRERTPSESDSADESPQKKSHHYKNKSPKKKSSCYAEKFSLFISYTHNDNTKNFAGRLREDLKRKGWEVFIDTEGIGTGDDLPETIVREINNCNGMIVVLTKNYYESKWCPKEVDYAVAQGKKLYPLLRAEMKYIPPTLHINPTRVLYSNFCEENKYDVSLKQLVKDIEKDAKQRGF